MSVKISKFLIFTFLATLSFAYTETGSIEAEEKLQPSKILSRRKRFLVFPDGSSFQLVFCTQNHGYLQVGDIVWFGNTAALAWELPTDPSLFYWLKNESRLYGDQLRRQDSKKIIYLDEDGKVLSAVPYHKKFIANPAFAKRSIDEARKPVSIKQMHESQKNRSYLYDLDETSTEFHRQGRISLYEKLELFLQALGYRGKECILRMLCESSKANHEQGTFLEEIMRSTFTFPRSNLGSSYDLEYDLAHGSSGDCSKLYPQCENLRENFVYT